MASCRRNAPHAAVARCRLPPCPPSTRSIALAFCRTCISCSAAPKPAPDCPPPLPTPARRPACSPFDTKNGRLMLGLTVASGGGWIITNVQQRFRDPQWKQFLTLFLVFWCAPGLPVAPPLPCSSLLCVAFCNHTCLLGAARRVIFTIKTTLVYVRQLNSPDAAATPAAPANDGGSGGTKESPARRRRTRRD